MSFTESSSGSSRTFGSQDTRTGLEPLWKQLLLKNHPLIPPPASESRPMLNQMPPVTPMDKAGTSMRMLLHDTQLQFEKFSEHVVKLTDEVGDAKRDINTTQKLFEREQEKLLGDIVDLVNRCQTQVQKSLGTPAQVSDSEDLKQKIALLDVQLAALNSKVDMIQMLNQTQSQALQMIQDQQSQLLTSLSPILPLLNSIPLHVENAKLDVKEAIARSQLSHAASFQAFCASLPKNSLVDNSNPARTSGPRRRSVMLASPSSAGAELSSGSPPRKRRREESSERSDTHPRNQYPLRSPSRDTIPLSAQSETLTASDSAANGKNANELSIANCTGRVTRTQAAPPLGEPLSSDFIAMLLENSPTTPGPSQAEEPVVPQYAIPLPPTTTAMEKVVSPESIDTSYDKAGLNRQESDLANMRGSTMGSMVALVPATDVQKENDQGGGTVGPPRQLPSKPLSLKDVRVREALRESMMWNHGKRIITIDDDDDDDGYFD